MPATAPPTALAVLVEAWKVASRKTADSKPSRSTARKAIATSAHDVPSDMAPEVESSRSRLRKRACLLIHRTIAVTKATATRPITVSIPSCCRWGRLRSTRSRAPPTPPPPLLSPGQAAPAQNGGHPPPRGPADRRPPPPPHGSQGRPVATQE